MIRPISGSKHSTTTTRKPSVTTAASAPREVNPTDSITSSYGVGPTDESGRPLFGLRALRRSQQQEPGSVVIDQQPAADTPDTTSEVKDSSGRPLFGLRALKKEDSSRSPDKSSPRDQSPAANSEEPKPHVMPERAPSSGQLRDLVQRHEQRTSTGSTTTSSQKPRAKLRDSFITQEIRGSVTRTSKEEALTSRNAERSNALRAIIQKHETITDSEQSKLVRKDSSRIESKQTTQSIHENGVQERSSPAPRTEREESPKLAGDPIRRPSTEGSQLTEQTRRPGILKKPRDSPERSTTSTTTSSTAVSTATINLRKVDEASVNKIIEDTRRSSITRSPPDGSTTNTFELESPRAVAEITQRALDKDKDFDEEQIITDEDGGETRIRRTHKEEKDELGSRSFTRTAAVSKRSEPGREERYTAVTTSVTQQRSTTGTPPSPGKPEHSIARVGRSGSVKALQQRTPGTGATDTSAKLRGAGYQKAGLIFRTNSFQHTNGCGPDLPAVAEEQRRQTGSTSRSSSSVTVSKSFLGNETRVTGVQDILTRMREADHEEVTPGTNEEDREARALLNKFLGAQVLLQGMEPLIAAQSPALVSQVERQRIVVSTSSSSAKHSFDHRYVMRII
ncbi:hypothetical protein B566_EDAN010275 [Ephemera danica]|nr:hypothetical protein B566_EDAN010275 [Ephemera danica]